MATGTDAQIARALLEHLKSLVLTPALPVAYPDSEFSPTENSPHLEAEIFLAPTATISVDDSAQNQINGFLQVNVVYPQNAGAIQPAEVASRVITHFRRGSVLTDGTTKVQIMLAPYKMTPLKMPPYVKHPVTIRFQAFASQ